MFYVGVIGSGECNEETGTHAFEVGRDIAFRGGILVCGGLGGVMEQACRGCKDGGGVSIGVLPGSERLDANQYVTYALATGMGEMRNFLVVRLSDVLISVFRGIWDTV
jgi:uncharacterized protein (TIGR00725 family)